MSRSVWPSPAIASSQRRAELLNPNGFRVALVSAGSIVVLAVGLLSARLGPLRAGDQPLAGSKHQADAALRLPGSSPRAAGR